MIFVYGGIILLIAAITTAVIVLARKKSHHVKGGCHPPCKPGQTCQEDKCVTTRIPCEKGSCPTHQVCMNPGQENAQCINCITSANCEWSKTNTICLNKGTSESKCVQCLQNSDCGPGGICDTKTNECENKCAAKIPPPGKYRIKTLSRHGEKLTWPYVFVCTGDPSSCACTNKTYKFPDSVLSVSDDQADATIFDWKCADASSSAGSLSVGDSALGLATVQGSYGSTMYCPYLTDTSKSVSWTLTPASSSYGDLGSFWLTTGSQTGSVMLGDVDSQCAMPLWLMPLDYGPLIKFEAV
jgi:Cys-rich repeat protein